MNMQTEQNKKDFRKDGDFGELESRLRKGRKDYDAIPVPADMEERVKRAAARAGKIRRFRMPAAVAAAAAGYFALYLMRAGNDGIRVLPYQTFMFHDMVRLLSDVN